MKKILVICCLLVCCAGAAYSYIMSGLEINNQRGCCSRHGGVSYCGKSGYYVCADGSQSPSCRCR